MVFESKQMSRVKIIDYGFDVIKRIQLFSRLEEYFEEVADLVR